VSVIGCVDDNVAGVDGSDVQRSHSWDSIAVNNTVSNHCE